jgi:hypothetical protein
MGMLTSTVRMAGTNRIVPSAPLGNPTQVVANLANSRRNCDPLMREPERFEGLINWRLDCLNKGDELKLCL